MFYEDEITEIKIEDSPDNLAILITNYLCGDLAKLELTEHDRQLLRVILKKCKSEGLTYNQFKELLLLLNQDIIEEPFFKFFFRKDKLFLEDIKKGIINFRGYAMLCFGNFRFAYKQLINKSEIEIINCLSQYCKDLDEIKSNYQKRTIKMLDITKIPKEKTWLLGFLTRDKVNKDAKVVNEEGDKIKTDESDYNKKDLMMLRERINSHDELIKEVHKIALINTDIYLTWDYIDVYVATSMRNSWEFEETYDFINKVFNQEKLQKFKLRYFDPTQSLCSNVRDKGLLEGLMLKCAKCTIYLAQESDTMGKDSELAASLAQSKPVIAYVPNIDPIIYSKKISKYPLSFFKMRFLNHNAEGMFNDPNLTVQLKEYDSKYEEIIQRFLDEYDVHSNNHPISIWYEKEEEFKKDFTKFISICDILAKIEQYYFDKRADLLRERHPLSMQVDLQTGVANGVLVIRSPEECAELLNNILLNQLTFFIVHKKYENKILNKTDECTLLIEQISGSPFRVITNHEKLTNSFWNLWKFNH